MIPTVGFPNVPISDTDIVSREDEIRIRISSPGDEFRIRISSPLDIRSYTNWETKFAYKTNRILWFSMRRHSLTNQRNALVKHSEFNEFR